MFAVAHRIFFSLAVVFLAGGAITSPAAAEDGADVEQALAEVGFLDDGASRADISADAADGSVSIGVELVIESRTIAGASDRVSDSTTAVYSAIPATDGVVQETADGVRLMTVLSDASAPTTFSYEFPGAVLIPQSDGTVHVEAGDAVAVVAPAWAVDANGQDVPTHYSVNGTTLIQAVEHRGAQYPVVADPWVTLGWGWYLHYSRAEVKRIAPYAWTNRLYAVACAAIPNVYVAAACAVAIDNWMSSLSSTFVSAARANKCVELHFATTMYTLLGYRAYSC